MGGEGDEGERRMEGARGVAGSGPRTWSSWRNIDLEGSVEC